MNTKEMEIEGMKDEFVTTPRTEEEFEKYYDLRWRVLRQPWGQAKGSEKDELEESSFHVMVCGEDGEAVAVGRLHFNSEEQCQIRYMSVEEDCRGKGYGKIVLDRLEQIAKEQGAREIVLNAREGAAGFYEGAGYEITGPGHTLFGSVKHFKMAKLVTCAQ